MQTSDFDFELPPELIASTPLEKRDTSRMLVVTPLTGVEFPSMEGWPKAGVEFPSMEGWPKAGVVRNTVAYKSLPYNPKLKERAKQLRKAGSLPEALLWTEIKNKKLNGLDFDRQKVIGNYIVDFFCPTVGIVIEIDDKTHDLKIREDIVRDEYLRGLGLKIIRISAKDVLKNPHGVFEWLVLETTPALRATPPQRGTTTPAFGHPSAEGNLADRHIRDILDYIRPGDVVVVNNSRVIPARFMAGGYEITLHTSAGDDKTWWGLCKKFNKLSVGARLALDDGTEIEILAIDADSGIKIRFLCDDVFDVLDRVGKMPLPPYMHRAEAAADRERYQTVYASPLGSMAAPTAGLHFTPELMQEIEARGAQIVKITLHVGAGTWMPVKTEDLSQHKMHSEWCCITPTQADIINNAKRVIAVGTTSMRTLESAAMDAGKSGMNTRVAPICRETDIFITPGYKFRAVDVLVTNFHLPKSTLFMLVSAFAGRENMLAAYAHAVAEKYRFFSYGDSCLLFKNDGGEIDVIKV